jgi:hypothetical protein
MRTLAESVGWLLLHGLALTARTLRVLMSSLAQSARALAIRIGHEWQGGEAPALSPDPVIDPPDPARGVPLP